MLRWPRWALAGVMLTFSAPAAANGKFPSTEQLVVDPSDANHLVVRSTFGVLTSADRGASWGWVCESAAGYVDYEPPLAITSAGSIIVGLRDGLSVASSDACAWGRAGEIEGANVVDVSVSRAEPQVSVAIDFDLQRRRSRYYESRDDGRSFQSVGVELPDEIEALTVDVAPSNASRIYASGLRRVGEVTQGVLLRSDDRAESWTIFDVPGSDDVFAPYIAAVHPTDDDRIYVRLSGGPGRLYESEGGGGRLREIWRAEIGILRGFALSPDGSQVVVATEFDGLFHANADERVFMKRSSLPIRCLAWSSDGLYACVNSLLYEDPLVVGLSEDGGATFSPLLTLPCVVPQPCSADAPATTECVGVFEELAPRIGTDQCGVAGGTAGNGGAGGQTVEPEPPPSGGCGACVVGTTQTPSPDERRGRNAALLATLLLTALRRRT